MVVATKNSLFIHFPKNAGRWISQALINNVRGSYYIGDEIYDAHQLVEIEDKKVFVCVRDPVTWLHSLWHHRSRRKGFKGIRRLNWQKEYLIEKSGSKSKDFKSFIDKVVELDNPMMNYYQNFIPNVDELYFIYFENLGNSLISFLKFAEEEFDENQILKFEKVTINSTNRKRSEGKISNSFQMNEIQLKKLIENNEGFYNLTQYKYAKNNLICPNGFRKVDIDQLSKNNYLPKKTIKGYEFLKTINLTYENKNIFQKELNALVPNYLKKFIKNLIFLGLKINFLILRKILFYYISIRYKPKNIIGYFPKSKICLEFGGGENPIKRKDGYLNVDIRDLSCVDIVSPVNNIKDKFDYKSVQAIFSRHFLEHLTLKELGNHLEDCQYLLGDGGFLEGIVPSTEFHILQLLCSQQGSKVYMHALAGFNGWQRGQNISYWDVHKLTFTYSFLKYIFMKYGFSIEFKKSKLKNIHFIAKPNRGIILNKR